MTDTPIDYTIRRAGAEDGVGIMNLLRAHFYKDCPISVAVGLPPSGHTCGGALTSLPCLQENLSLVAVTTHDGQEDIIGVALIGESTSRDEHISVESKGCPKDLQIRQFFHTVQHNADIWKRTGQTRCWEMHLLVVCTSARRHGVARALVQRAQAMAAQEGQAMLTATCTSHYSAGLMQNLGWKCWYALRYDEYLDNSGVPVLRPPEPHVAVQCYALLLEAGKAP